MNYELLELPLFTDTLDFENVNAPFIVADKNNHFLTQYAEKLSILATGLRIYTDEDEITIISNGVKDYFKVNLSTLEVDVYGGVIIIGDEYVKDNTPEDDISSSTPLNMKELSLDMVRNGYLPNTFVYKYMLDKRELLLSNMLSYSEMEEVCIKRSSGDVTLVSPYCIMRAKTSSEIVDRKTMENEFIHKTKKIDQINVKNDSITSVDGDETVASFVEFEDGYEAENDTDSIALKKAKDDGYSLEGIMRAPVYIAEPEESRSPVNKKTMDAKTSLYISKTEKEADNIIIDRSIALVEDNFILSSDEARVYIDEYFKKYTDPSIDNIDNFREYLKMLCEFGEDYIDYSFSIEGGKIYIGFDYNNMFSVFNSEAIKRILLEQTGQFSVDMGITFDASRYFKDQSKIDKLAAYAQAVGLEFDISSDTIAQVFKKIRGIVGKLCIMTPDVIPEKPPLEIPVFSPRSIIIPPMFPSFTVPYISVYMFTPMYFKPYKFFMISPPNFSTRTAPYMAPFLQTIFYRKDFKFSNIIPPVLANPPVSTSFNPNINKPTPQQDCNPVEFSKVDGKVDTLVFFASEDYCKDRYVVVSTRTVNMMDMGVILSKFIYNMSGKYFWCDYNSSAIMTLPQMAIAILGDVACLIAEKTDFAMNVDFRNVIDKIPPTEDGTTPSPESNCMPMTSASGGGTVEPPASSDILSLSTRTLALNGINVIPNGTVSGTPILEVTEFTPGVAGDLPSWAVYRGEEYKALVEKIVNTFLLSFDSYTTGRRLDNWDEILTRPASIAPLSNIGPSIALAEYLRLQHGKKAGFAFDSLADPLGIFYSGLSMDPTPLTESVFPYDNIVVGGHTAPSGNWSDYRQIPPPPVPGETKIHVWKPMFSGLDKPIATVPYLSLDSSTKSVISVYGPIIFIEDLGGGNYGYDYANAPSTSASTTIIEVTDPNNGQTEEIEYHIISYEGNTVVLGKVANTSAPTRVSYARAICDPWRSPYELFAYVNPGGEITGNISLNPFMSTGRIAKTNMKVKQMNLSMGGGECVEPDQGMTSGIDGATASNISDLTSIDPDTSSQTEGEVPGAISMTLNMRLTKYAPEMNQSTGAIDDVVESGVVKLCVTLGVVDGVSNEDGDVLAQGLSQSEIEEAGGEPKVYVGPTPMFKAVTTLERRTIAGKEVSVFTMGVASLVENNAQYANGGNFMTYWDPSDGVEKTATVQLKPNSYKQEEETALGVISCGEFSTAGMTYSYKHNSGKPDQPIVIGHGGSSEVDFINGNRIVSTIPTKIPNVIVVSDAAAAEAEISSLNPADNQVQFIMTNDSIVACVPDAKAMLSGNRDVKCIW